MDKHSEVEAKFDVTDHFDKHNDMIINIDEKLKELVVDGETYKVSRYLDMAGVDSFYRIGKKVFRYRSDVITKQIDYHEHGGSTVRVAGANGKAESDGFQANQFLLTVKERKTKKSLFNRAEIDIPLRAERGDFEAFMSMLDVEPWYQIKKEYKIWQLESGNGIKVCVAVYTVYRPDGSDRKRFLEVEIEKDSACSPKQGMSTLRKWVTFLRTTFGLDTPSNQSLSELYCPKEKE